MQSSSRTEVIFNPTETPGMEDAQIRVRPLKGVDRTRIMGELQAENANIGEIAVRVCRKTVRGWNEDVLGRYVHGPNVVDEWEPELHFEVFGFVMNKCQVSEAQAGD